MGFRSDHRLNMKVGGNNHLNEGVLFDTGDAWGIPLLDAIQRVEIKNLSPFTHREPGDAIHFFLEDHALNRIWNRVEYYGEKFRDKKLVLSPDFSLFTDFPLVLQLFNTYRSRYVGRYWQEMGLNVAPSVTWSDERSFEFCFSGLPQNSVLAISTQGAKNKPLFFKGFEKMIEMTNPVQILVYGTARYMPEIASYGIESQFFQTHFEQKRNGWKG